MALTETVTLSWSNGNSLPSRSISFVVDYEISLDVGLLISGHRIATVNENLPPMNNLMCVYGNFPGNVIVRTHLSGSYLSGGTGNVYYISSGIPFMWVNQVSGLPNPFFPATNSGLITAISFQNMSSGIVSGNWRMGFSGIITSG